jgi:ubiquinone/menaquinone biosynthesis C-methylase UbiE
MNSKKLMTEQIISDYYSNIFSKLCHSGVNLKGSRWFYKKIRRLIPNVQDKIILEVGGGSSEFLKAGNLDLLNNCDKYFTLDLIDNLDRIKSTFSNSKAKIDKLSFIKADVESIPLLDKSVDVVVSTCLFAHIDRPLEALLEVKRILKPGGSFIVGLPTDPGLLNRTLKKLITYSKLKKLGEQNPRLVYALEHQNSVSNLIAIINYVFQDDLKIYRYLPFFIRSWNLNLGIFIRIEVR